MPEPRARAPARAHTRIGLACEWSVHGGWLPMMGVWRALSSARYSLPARAAASLVSGPGLAVRRRAGSGLRRRAGCIYMDHGLSCRSEAIAPRTRESTVETAATRGARVSARAHAGTARPRATVSRFASPSVALADSVSGVTIIFTFGSAIDNKVSTRISTTHGLSRPGGGRRGF